MNKKAKESDEEIKKNSMLFYQVNIKKFILLASLFAQFSIVHGQDSTYYFGNEVSELLKIKETVEFVQIENINTFDVITILDSCPNLETLILSRFTDVFILLDSSKAYTNIQFLDISSCNLKFVPSWVYRCRNLKGLVLYDNNLTEISDEIENLSSLEMLSLGYNRFRKLSQIRSINKISGLFLLSLEGNKRLEFDAEIINIQRVTLLNVKISKEDAYYFKKAFPNIESVCVLDSKLGFHILSRGIKIRCDNTSW